MRTLLFGLAVCLLLGGCQGQEPLAKGPKKAPVETPGLLEQTINELKQWGEMHQRFREANQRLRMELERGEPDPPPEPPPDVAGN
jgi:hypothetical protein